MAVLAGVVAGHLHARPLDVRDAVEVAARRVPDEDWEAVRRERVPIGGGAEPEWDVALDSQHETAGAAEEVVPQTCAGGEREQAGAGAGSRRGHVEVDA